jgi:subtilisin family serine protease
LTLVKSLALISVFFAAIVPQISADDVLSSDFSLDFPWDNKRHIEDGFLWDEGDHLFEPMTFYRNNATHYSGSSSIQTEDASEPRSSVVEPPSIRHTNNSVLQNYEIFISPISGEEFEIIKDPVNETKKYRDQNGTVFDDKDELLNYEIERLPISPNLLKLDARLREIVVIGDANASVPVIIAFVEQPAHNVSIEVQAMYEPIFEEITAPAKAVYERIEPMIAAADGDTDVIALEQELLTVEEKDLLNETASRLDQETMQMRRDIFERSAPLVDEIQAPVVEKIQANGGEVGHRDTIYNAIAASVPIGYLEKLSEDPSIAAIWYVELLNMTLKYSVPTIDAKKWWDNGYTGGTWDVAVVDTGIDSTHPALLAHPIPAKTFHNYAKTYYLWEYNDNQATTDDLVWHGTHCAGIVASTDSLYRGVGYGIDELINAKAAWKDITGKGRIEWPDAAESIEWAIWGIPDGADVISFSSGGYPGSTGDTGFCHYMDAVVFTLGVPVVVAAGNDGPASKTVNEPGSAYNVITVGNVDDKNTLTRDDDVICTVPDLESSIGPTGDNRLKPDISAPGTEIISCNYDYEGGYPWGSATGTSMATPHVAGSIPLILNYVGIQWNDKAIKALLLNTASDKGDIIGPDNTYGYGYLDLNRAYTRRGYVYKGSLADKPEGTVEKYYKGAINNGDKATLVWDRHVDYVHYIDENWPTNYLTLSDLDLYIYDESNNGQISYSLSSLNNTEQVKSGSTYSSAIIKIEPSPYPSGITSESYALATDGPFTEVNPPTLSASLSFSPSTIESGATFTATATVTNTGGIRGHGVSATLNLPSGFTIISGSNPQYLGSIDPGSGNSKSATWTVRAPTTSSTQSYTISTSINSYSYADSYTASSSKTIFVGPNRPPTTPSTPSGPTSGTSGVSYTYTTSANDPDGDQIKYTFEWMDGTTSTTALVKSGATASASHSWNVPAGSTTKYYIRVKATDSRGKSSEWSNQLPVSITGVNRPDTIGVFRPSTKTWYLDYNNDGVPDKILAYGLNGDLPVSGDWNGDGRDTIGVFRPSTRTWYLDYNNDRVPDKIFAYGLNGDLPVAGDWNSNGIDTVGVFRPTTRTWYLDYNNDGVPDKILAYGLSGDLPVAGDWNKDGTDTIGVFRPTTRTWYLDYNNDRVPDKIFAFGLNGDLPLVGDWNNDGIDTVGVFRPTTRTWYLDYNNDGVPDKILAYGLNGDKPVSGDWYKN